MTRIITDLEPLAYPLDMLSPMPGNPRRGDIDAVARSYATFGQRKPIVCRHEGEGGIVLAGNHQLAAARKLGWDTIAVVWVDDDDLTAKAFSLADNRTGDLGDYDNELLAEMLADVAVDDELLAATAWTQDAIDALGPTQIPAALNDPDDTPEPPAVAKTVPGDVWLLGPHRVMCGDSTVPTDVERLMDGAKADMVWTDPPYGVSYVGKTADALTIENDGAGGLDALLAGAVESILQGCSAGAAVYVAAPPGPQSHCFAQALVDAGLWRQRLIWVKSSLVLGHSDYHYKHEDIYFGYVPGAKGRRGRGGDGWYGDHSQTSVLEFDKPARSGVHPTMKPVALISYCVTNSSAPGDIVLDLFGGSGSTLIAAHDTGRAARLMELSPAYVDVICRRYQEHTGTVPVAEATGNPHDFTV